MSETGSLAVRFLDSARHFPDRPALEVAGRRVTYRELESLALSIAATIQRHEPDARPIAAVLAHRSLAAYAGVLGVLASGRGYVPLQPHFPPGRTRHMLAASGCRTIVVGEEAIGVLADVLDGAPGPLTVVLPFVDRANDPIAALEPHRVVTAGELSRESEWVGPAAATGSQIAYVMFTSGSTGAPKGVPVSQANVTAYVDHVRAIYGVDEHDRFSQTFDLTFDLSAHDLFVCWSSGACLCCLPDTSLIGPAKFIRDKALTMWFSVPTLGMQMQRLRMLGPGAFPRLRFSLFCGEALPASLASAWQKAAPDSTVENLYGPTEATIAILRYRWDERRSPGEVVNGIVPIGEPFPGQLARVVGDDLRPVPDGVVGELCLSGSQVVAGYLDDPQKTAEQFVAQPDLPGVTWYRTGDLARHDPHIGHQFLGRLDSQVKVRGWRVELQEVEQAVREAAGEEMVACVAWPVRDGSAEGVVAFVATTGIGPTDAEIIEACRRLLPDYMVPGRIVRVDALPLNARGKIDRGKLLTMLGDNEAP